MKAQSLGKFFRVCLSNTFTTSQSKQRAAKLLNTLQQDPHKSIGEYVWRGSEIIQVHSGKTNFRDISASQYGWNIVQGLNNVPIKNKITDHIANCNSLSDVCKLIRQVRREMENREAFTGISAEPEESIDEVNWRQNNSNQRGRDYSNRGSNRGSTEVITICPAKPQDEENTTLMVTTIQEVMLTQRKQVP